VETIERVRAIGWRADAALRAAGGEARVLAALAASVYVDVAGEVLWLGPRDATPHGRAIHVAGLPPARTLSAGAAIRVACPALAPWRPSRAPAAGAAVAALRAGAARLDAGALGAPRGLGVWLAGGPLGFPLEAARARLDALARACAEDDAARAATAAIDLLGLGPGLTPSGDDLVGGAFFARALLARAGAVDAAAWRAAAAAVRAAAPAHTHPIGAALLADLLVGEGWAPLHDLAAALARGDEAGALEAGGRLTGLGHSSGWDLLAGFVVGARA
jgi:hypothetical protein